MTTENSKTPEAIEEFDKRFFRENPTFRTPVTRKDVLAAFPSKQIPLLYRWFVLSEYVTGEGYRSHVLGEPKLPFGRIIELPLTDEQFDAVLS